MLDEISPKFIAKPTLLEVFREIISLFTGLSLKEKIIFLAWSLVNHLVALLTLGFMVLQSQGSISKFQNCLLYSYTPSRTLTGWAVCLGNLIIAPKDSNQSLLLHEYGHHKQSLWLGPFYFLAVGLPSFIRAMRFNFTKKTLKHRYEYFHCFIEGWADQLGGIYQQHEHPKADFKAYLPWKYF